MNDIKCINCNLTLEQTISGASGLAGCPKNTHKFPVVNTTPNSHEPKSACCGKIARLSVSTRHGRRLFCELCGKPFIPASEKDHICDDKSKCMLCDKKFEKPSTDETPDWMEEEREKFGKLLYESFAKGGFSTTDLDGSWVVDNVLVCDYWLSRMAEKIEAARKIGYQQCNVVSAEAIPIWMQQGRIEEKARIGFLVEGMIQVSDEPFKSALGRLLANLKSDE